MGRRSLAKTWTPEEFAKSDLRTRLRIHLYNFEAYPLSPAEAEKLEQLEVVFSAMRAHPSMAHAIRVLKMTTKWDLQRSQWYNLCADAGAVFGKVHQHTRELRKQILIEKYYSLAEALEARGDLEASKRCLDKVGEYEQFDKPEPDFDPDQITIGDIEFTTDPTALAESALDIDYEEVEES